MSRPRTTVRIVTLLLSLIAIVVIIQPGQLFAQDASLCYWESSQGQRVDLSTLCGQAPNKTKPPSLQSYPKSIQQEVNQYIRLTSCWIDLG
jgi:hypothetical protein